MPSIALALAALKPGPYHPRQPIADPTVQMLASFLVLLALFPLLTPLMGRPYAPKPDKWGASRPGCLRNPQQDAPQAPHQ